MGACQYSCSLENSLDDDDDDDDEWDDRDDDDDISEVETQAGR